MGFTNSGLVTHTRYSKKHSGLRTQPITKIVIHHWVGYIKAKDMLDYLATTKRDMSVNYVIGYDGSIGLSVPERFRAWTSSSAWVDNRAVTIEVSNDQNLGPEWRITDKAMQSLIKLVADISKRNNIQEVTYTGGKDGVLQKHRWYSATGCPGPYLDKKFSYIAREANSILKKKPYIASTVKDAPLGEYKVIVNRLNIRKEPTSKSLRVGAITDKLRYTIVRTIGNWGLLKSQIGWIYLRGYTEYVGDPQLKSIKEIAKEVLAGRWGNGKDRVERLEEAGYNYLEVQKEVNKLI